MIPNSWDNKWEEQPSSTITKATMETMETVETMAIGEEIKDQRDLDLCPKFLLLSLLFNPVILDLNLPLLHKWEAIICLKL